MLKFPNNLFCAIGQIVVYWSMIEHSMHDCLSLIYHKCDGKNKIIPDQELPFSLSKMIDFWDKSFKKLAPLFPFKLKGLIILKQIKDLKTDRHIVTHGTFIGMRNDSVLFAKLRLDIKDERIFNLFKETINNLDEIGKKIQGLAKNIQDFSYRLHEQFGN